MITADYLLESLNEIGIRYIFCNLGTDHAPIIEAMAQWQSVGRKYPCVILCPHENVALAMATGFAQATGQGQAVLIHVDVGTANAAMGIINAFRTRIPVLLMAGKAPFAIHGELPGGRDNYIHFLQDSADMGGIVRPYVKWEYTLLSGVTVKETVRRAHSIMQSDPKGPVYLMLPREVLAETWCEEKITSFAADKYGPVPASGVEDSVIHEIANRLVSAENPILITAYSGRNLNSPLIIDELARLAGIKVFESHPSVLNVPRDSPCFFGFSPEQEIARADFGIMVDVDVPWIPMNHKESSDSYWVHIDVDVLKKDIPMWGFPAHMRIQGDSAKILLRLVKILKEDANIEQRAKVDRRLTAFAQASKEPHNEVPDTNDKRGIDPAFLCSELDKAILPDDIIVNETIRNSPTVLRQIKRTKPGTFLACGGSGLGYGGGAALGAKLANPSRTVIHLTGDGSFYFSNPSAVYEVSKRYGLPIFSVIFENGGWAAVKESTRLLYPDGISTRTNQFQALLDRQIAFEKIGEAAGFHGESVTDPEQVPEAIQRCLAAVKGGQSAILVAHLRGELC